MGRHAVRGPSTRQPTALRSSTGMISMDGAREVLVVEDKDDARRVVCLLLRHHGLAVREASGGREAVDAYRAHRDCIGVVLLDVLMPGLDGPGTLALLKAIDPYVRCCFLTGGAGDYT